MLKLTKVGDEGGCSGRMLKLKGVEVEGGRGLFHLRSEATKGGLRCSTVTRSPGCRSEFAMAGMRWFHTRDMPLVGILQYNIFRQQEYCSTKYSVRRNISAQNIQPVGIFQYNISVQNIQAVGIFQYKIFSQEEYFSTKYSVRRNISVQNCQSVGIFQYKIFSPWEWFKQNIQSVGIFRYKTFNP
jgi:hypothetical protein